MPLALFLCSLMLISHNLSLASVFCPGITCGGFELVILVVRNASQTRK